MWQDFHCPCCNEPVDVEVERWTTKTACPFCEKDLIVKYDMIYNEEDNEEWDIYTLEVPSGEDEKRWLDYSRIR